MAVVAGGEFTGLDDDAVVERKEEFHDLGIAPTALGFFLHDVEGSGGRKGRFVRPGVCERVVDVDGLQYAGQQGDLLAAQPIGVTAAIPAFMVVRSEEHTSE